MILDITLITGSHLSSNPRLVKEAKALLSAGYKLHILCSQNIDELSNFDKEIFKDLYPANIHIINYQKKLLKPWYLRIKSAMRLKLAGIKFLKHLPYLKQTEKSRMFPEMTATLKHIKTDLYIAHTLAALPAAAWAASYHKSKYAFDAEDFHSGETNDPIQKQQIIAFENEFLKDCSYLSTASPLSSELYQQRYPQLKIITINNVFPFSNLNSEKVSIFKPLKIVWFSQTIGLNRGLQEFISALSLLDSKSYELHLRGSYNEEIKNELLSYAPNEWKHSIFFYQQCSSTYLEEWLLHFDVGLALEHKGDLNKELCISNKIFQYISAGLGIIATDTEGQKWVLKQAKEIGVVVSQDEMNLAANQLKFWSENPSKLKFIKQNALIAARTIFNWDLEKNKLLQQILLINKNEYR